MCQGVTEFWGSFGEYRGVSRSVAECQGVWRRFVEYLGVSQCAMECRGVELALVKLGGFGLQA